jgi:hypothetical protein
MSVVSRELSEDQIMSGIGISRTFIRSDNSLELTVYCMALRLDRKDLLPSRYAKL